MTGPTSPVRRKILFFSDHFHPEPSAPASHVYDRCRIWARDGHDVTVVTSAPNFPLGEVYEGYTNAFRTVEVMEGVRVVRVKTYMAENKGTAKRILDYLSYAASAFVQAWRERRPDVVISTSPHLFVAMAGAAYAQLRRVPHVMEVRDLWPASIAAVAGLDPASRLYRALERIELTLYRASRRIAVVTESYREDMVARGVPADKIALVRNGANLDLFRECPHDPDLAASLGLTGRFVAGYLGTIGGAHALATVIEAAELLQNENVVFLMVGVGAEKDALEALAREKGLNNVVFAGRRPKEEMPSYWGLCDVSLIHLKDNPVFTTVIPTKIFETLAVGIPMIYGVPYGEGARIVEQTGAGLVISPEDAQALADAVRTLRDDKALYASLSRKAADAAPEFSREKQAAETLAVIESAISRKSGSP